MGKHVKLTEQQLSQVYALRLQHVPWEDIPQRIGVYIKAEALRKQYEKIYQSRQETPEETPHIIQHLQAQIGDLTAKLEHSAYAHIERELRKVERERDRFKSAGRTIWAFCEDHMDRLRCKPAPIPTYKPSKHRSSHMALFSDVHYGSRVTLNDTNGLSEYSIALCRERHARHMGKLLYFRAKDAAAHGLDDLIMPVLGDLVDGTHIYEGQRFHLDNQSMVQQVFEFCDLWQASLLELAQAYHRIILPCISGNHGRPARKGEHHPLDNADYLIYRIMAERMRPQENITFLIAESPQMAIRIGKLAYVFGHGHGIKSSMGIPYYGISRRIGRLNDLYQTPIAHYFQGHIHTDASIDNKRGMCNGSYKGPDDLSVNTMGVGGRPSQKLMKIDTENGVYDETAIWLADQPKLVFDEQGIGTPYYKQA